MVRLEESSGSLTLSEPPFSNTATTIGKAHSDGPAVAWKPQPTISVDPTRKKRYHQKARTGCFICRRRRVKCDEQKPSCLRCYKVNEMCHYEGAAPQSTSALGQYRLSLLPSAPERLDLSFLQFFTLHTKDALSTPPSSLVDRYPSMHLAPDTASERFWNCLGLPLVHVEPLLLELVVILGKTHRKALEPESSRGDTPLEVINVLSKIVKTRPLDIVVIGSQLATAFQILYLTSTGDFAPVEDGAHTIAFSRLLLSSSDTVFEYITRTTDVTRVSLTICATVRGDQFLQIPEHFLDLEDAQYYFTEIMKLHLLRLRPTLEKWLGTMLKLYELARGKDWEHSKEILTLFIYGRHILMILDLQLNASPDQREAWEAVVEKDQLKSRVSSRSTEEDTSKWAMAWMPPDSSFHPDPTIEQ